jgi:hypothetical protein
MRLRIDEICYHFEGYKSPECKREIARYLKSQGFDWKPMNEIWDHFNSVVLGSTTWTKDISQKGIREEILRQSPAYHFDGYQSGIYLREPVEVVKEISPYYFKYFFCFMFKKLSAGLELQYDRAPGSDKRIDKNLFLSFHLSESFQNNNSEYRLFLKDCMDQIHTGKSYLLIRA